MEDLGETTIRILLFVGVLFLAAYLLNGGKAPHGSDPVQLHGPLSGSPPAHRLN